MTQRVKRNAKPSEPTISTPADDLLRALTNLVNRLTDLVSAVVEEREDG